jgi:Na+-transporting methylmalonyl-CoA/oxaloacetate decarboxylase gamma subunit
VEISAPSFQALPADRWRTATIIASGVAVFELLIILIVVTALIGKGVSAHAKEAALTRATGTPQKTFRPEPKHATLTRGETSVIVLNGNGVAGAAAASSDRVKAKGYAIASTGNAPRSDYGQSVVMYRAGRKPEAQRLARDLGIKLVGPLEGMSTRDLLGAHLALVLGN